MKIGEFIEKVQTTKDTVRHYEELELIKPSWYSKRRIYGEKNVQDFEAIKEMQALGMNLKEIQIMFEVKRSNGCGSPQLLIGIIDKMKEKRHQVELEEQAIKYKKEQIIEMIGTLETLVKRN